AVVPAFGTVQLSPSGEVRRRPDSPAATNCVPVQMTFFSVVKPPLGTLRSDHVMPSDDEAIAPLSPTATHLLPEPATAPRLCMFDGSVRDVHARPSGDVSTVNVTPLKRTVLPAAPATKPRPSMRTCCPGAPAEGVKLMISGGELPPVVGAGAAESPP